MSTVMIMTFINSSSLFWINIKTWHIPFLNLYLLLPSQVLFNALFYDFIPKIRHQQKDLVLILQS